MAPMSSDPDPFRDAPLFRELQRVMASSTGPVNWELARQVGIANAAEAGEDPAVPEMQGGLFEDAVRLAELHVTKLTGLEPPGDLAQVRVVRRAEWVSASTEGLRGLLETSAGQIAAALERATRDQMPEEAQGMGGLMTQLSPLLMGTQVGSVLGFLAQRVLGQFDVAVPRSGPPVMLFVWSNIAAFERDWTLDPTDLRTLIALHEVAHRFEFARPWSEPRLRELLEDFGATLRIDVEGMQARLSSLDASDPDSLRALMDGEEGLFGTELDDEQRLKLARIQAFMAAAEGYADHVMHAIGRELLPSYARIDEALRRYREEDASDPVFERLLGVEMKRERYEAGRAFCDEVVEQTDEATLARMWESAEAMPSLPEVDEPVLWLARTV